MNFKIGIYAKKTTKTLRVYFPILITGGYAKLISVHNIKLVTTSEKNVGWENKSEGNE